MKKFNFGISTALLVLSILLINASKGILETVEGTAMGSGVWPTLIGIAMAILAIVLFFQTLLTSRRSKEGEQEEKPIDFKSPGMKRIYIMMGILAVFAVLIKLFGFYVSLIFLIPAIVVLLGERRVWMICALNAGIMVFVFVVFVLLLDLRLPVGSLMPW